MIVLLDADVLMDLLLEREPWHASASKIAQAHRDGRIVACVSSVTITNLFYVARRMFGRERTFRAVDQCLASYEILSVNEQILRHARAMPNADFEDNVQLSCAIAHQLDGVVTRDAAGYRDSPLPIFSPDAFLAHSSLARGT